MKTDNTLLARLGLETSPESPSLPGGWSGQWIGEGPAVPSFSPATGQVLGTVRQTSARECRRIVDRAVENFQKWRAVPAPRRGELVRRVANAIRDFRDELGQLVSLESGKILSEGQGEVQEMIDIADFAVGLSRQLYGLTMPSERPEHRMYEQWLPLGPVGCITAFNFPVAVWSWNAMIAAVCGDTVIWKPSEKTFLCAIAVQKLVERVCQEMGLPDVFFLACGGAEIGQMLAEDRRVPLVSATGSCAMGRQVGPTVARRLGRSLLELGGNNAAIVLADADQEMALRAILFAAAGTAGQRCTTLRRVILERPIAGEFTGRLRKAYASLSRHIGDPLAAGTLVGPLIDEDAVKSFETALGRIEQEGGEILVGGKRVDPAALPAALRGGFFVEPTLVRAPPAMAVMREETFAPLLYLSTAADLEEAIQLQNGVDQGLSSSIFTRDIAAAEAFLGPAGSDCGLANVNVGTSGAEIGGAFGGEKDTGGGREAGADAWKAYMRRQTCTINWGRDLPLAQGVEFDVGSE